VSNWVPESFTRLVDATRRGERPRVSVSELVGWFGFTRRGAQVNGYVRDAMRDAGVVCEPPFEKAFHDDELTFTTVTPIVIVAPPPTPPARELPHPVALFDAVIAAQSGVTSRVSTRLDAIERLVALLVFALIALQRNAPGTSGAEELRRVIDKHLPKDGAIGAPVSFGTWVDLARRLSALRLDPDDPIAEAARRVFSPAPRGEALGEVLSSKVVRARNHHHHASNLPASAWQEADAMLVEVGGALRQALAPLPGGGARERPPHSGRMSARRTATRCVSSTGATPTSARGSSRPALGSRPAGGISFARDVTRCALPPESSATRTQRPRRSACTSAERSRSTRGSA
jgi:hypothetical protein